MANYTRSHGANAQSWDEHEDQPQRTRSNWMPLETLDDDQVYAATPQLRAMPAPERQVFAPRRQAGREQIRPTTPHPTRGRTQQAQQQGGQAQTQARGVQARAVATLAGIAFAAVAGYAAVSAAVEWTQVKLDDFQYGRPRTAQVDAYVGHSEAEGVPSHFIAMNLNRRVTIIELPGGDSTKASTIVGPYLFGQGEDLTPVQAGVQDLNGDGKPDLTVSVKNEQLLYLNDGTSFKLATPEERASIQKSLQAAATIQKQPAGVTQEASK